MGSWLGGEGWCGVFGFLEVGLDYMGELKVVGAIYWLRL